MGPSSPIRIRYRIYEREYLTWQAFQPGVKLFVLRLA